MEHVTLTNMCMVTDGTRVVVQERTGHWPGIAFPGGHVETGESFTRAVIREVREETGLTIRAPVLCGIKDWSGKDDRYIVLLYKATQFSGELRSSEEGRVWWADLSELPRLNLASGMLDTIRLYGAEELSEIYVREEGEEWNTYFE